MPKRLNFKINTSFYVYVHIREDKNEPFYIGIGQNKDKSYTRAKTKNQRNPIWNRVYAKTTMRIEIVLESDNYMDAINKEKDLIRLYGKICDGTGILANITDGGEGTVGVPRTPEEIIKIKNSPGSAAARFKKGQEPYNHTPILDQETGIFYNSIKEASLITGKYDFGLARRIQRKTEKRFIKI